MTDSSEPQLSDDDPDVEPLAAWERTLSAIFGISLAAGGAAAVFVTKNQAGSVALLLIGGVLLVMTINGTPLLGAKYGDKELKLGRRRKRALAKVAEESPEVARQTLDVLAEYDPRIRNDPKAVAIYAETYEQLVLANLRLVLPQYRVIEQRHGVDSGVDAVVYLKDEPIANIVIKYSRSGAPITASRLMDELGKHANSKLPVLIVANALAPFEMKRRLREAKERFNVLAHFIQWENPAHNRGLKFEFESLIRIEHNS
ncbi:hypothetical protein [Actinoallomurus sp. CA-142502]|uniref:hypothetical protein n=1 Tax=Actinoallomurus sp. CA-142502 TaxID=3239885 RepID=UPI003D914252